MKKLLLLAISATLTFSAFTQDIVPNEVLVQLFDSYKVQDAVSQANDLFDNSAQIRVKRTLNENLNIHLISHSDEITESQLVTAFYSITGVNHAQLNHNIELRETEPLDPNYGNQWHHQNIDSELAWDITTGGETAVGDEIVVCVIEGGNLNHPDLQANAWVNTLEIPDNGIDDDGNGYVDDYDGWNVQSEDDEGVFNGGHGTQVMGMIGAEGDNDLGVAGINWDIKIMSVAGESLFNEASLVEAYGYPLDMRNLYESTNGAEGAFVVATNASWGLDGGQPEDSPIWCGLYQTLGEAGILNCGATANNNVDIDAVGDLPTACASDYMVSVTATNSNDVRTFSGYGQTTIDLGAPGEDVWTTSGNNTYGATSGTSFASPLTAGVIGLLYSVPCPGLMEIVHGDPQAGADLILQALYDGVDPIDNLTTECVTGGRINAFNSLNILVATCPDGGCFAPFSSEIITEDEVSFAIEWASFDEENAYAFRYKPTEDTEWTEVLDLTDSFYDLGELEWCTEYEYQIRTECSVDTITEWTTSTVIFTEGCCVSPELETVELELLGENEVEITWPSVLAAVTYNITYSQMGGLSTTIEDVTGGTYTLDGLEPCTDYDISIYSICEDGISVEENMISFRTLGCGHCTDATFCMTETESTEDEWIEEFSINDYTNTSGNDDGYGDFTGSEITLNRGNTAQIDVEVGYGGQTYNESIVVWIDLDQDGEFENSEMIASDESTSTGLSESVIIPEDALLGLTRLRVSVIWAGDVQLLQDPCGDYGYGETEDYCVVIEEFSSVEEVAQSSVAIFPNPASTQLNIRTEAFTAGMTYSIIDAVGRTVESSTLNSANSMIDISALNSGTYLIQIKSEETFIVKERIIKL
ncbi:MAG: S8 family serine peptidase [Flavobacteriales bacterium]